MRDRLFHEGHQVVGTWLDEVTKPDVLSTEQFDKRLALKDLQEIREADCFILDTQEESTTGGRMVELGFALAHMKLLYVVGRPLCIFTHLADKKFDSWGDLFTYFETEHPTKPYIASGMEGKTFSEPESRTGFLPIPMNTPYIPELSLRRGKE